LSLPSFFSLSHASSSSPASRASQLREKKHRVSQQPGVQITRNTTLKRASRDLKKNALALKRHANETVPFENLLDNKDDGAKDAVVHIVADILIYICCERGGEMCRKTSKRGSPPFEKKKKKKIERGGCHFGKKGIFWRINTQEKDDELSCDFEDDESKRESKEYAGIIRERKNSFSAGSCPFVARFFRFVGI
jgi:hypothetical protein